jgi:hypothetical protein
MAEATPAGERVRCPRLSRHGGDEVSASVLDPKLPPAAQTDSFPLDARRPDDRPPAATCRRRVTILQSLPGRDPSEARLRRNQHGDGTNEVQFHALQVGKGPVGN